MVRQLYLFKRCLRANSGWWNNILGPEKPITRLIFSRISFSYEESSEEQSNEEGSVLDENDEELNSDVTNEEIDDETNQTSEISETELSEVDLEELNGLVENFSEEVQVLEVFGTPIQEAVNALAVLTIEGNIIYVDGGIYNEDLHIDGSAAEGLENLEIRTSGNGGIPVINGTVFLSNLTGFSMEGLQITGIIKVENSSDIIIIGTDEDDIIRVNLHGV